MHVISLEGERKHRRCLIFGVASAMKTIEVGDVYSLLCAKGRGRVR